jgi:hypothetical protein
LLDARASGTFSLAGTFFFNMVRQIKRAELGGFSEFEMMVLMDEDMAEGRATGWNGNAVAASALENMMSDFPVVGADSYQIHGVHLHSQSHGSWRRKLEALVWQAQR